MTGIFLFLLFFIPFALIFAAVCQITGAVLARMLVRLWRL